MKIVNETFQEVSYTISYPGAGDCGTIAVDGVADLPEYDNKSEVTVSVDPSGSTFFQIQIAETGSGEQVEFAFLAE